MPRREFANSKALRDFAARSSQLYVWEDTASFTERQRLLSPEQYEIVDVHYAGGVRRAMLHAKTFLKAAWEHEAPFRSALGMKGGAEKNKR